MHFDQRHLSLPGALGISWGNSETSCHTSRDLGLLSWVPAWAQRLFFFKCAHTCTHTYHMNITHTYTHHILCTHITHTPYMYTYTTQATLPPAVTTLKLFWWEGAACLLHQSTLQVGLGWKPDFFSILYHYAHYFQFILKSGLYQISCLAPLKQSFLSHFLFPKLSSF